MLFFAGTDCPKRITMWQSLAIWDITLKLSEFHEVLKSEIPMQHLVIYHFFYKSQALLILVLSPLN